VNAHFVFFFAFLAFLTLGLSFRGFGGVFSAPLSAASKRAWASFSPYRSFSFVMRLNHVDNAKK
jgi:hypothetical protein